MHNQMIRNAAVVAFHFQNFQFIHAQVAAKFSISVIERKTKLSLQVIVWSQSKE
jgi:hypothetical protein